MTQSETVQPSCLLDYPHILWGATKSITANFHIGVAGYVAYKFSIGLGKVWTIINAIVNRFAA